MVFTRTHLLWGGGGCGVVTRAGGGHNAADAFHDCVSLARSYIRRRLHFLTGR